MIRILIDTNLWISALLSQKLQERLATLLANPEIYVLGHIELLEEVKEVAQRPKIQKYTTPEKVESLLLLLKDRLDWVTFHSDLHICRDEADNYLLAIAIDNEAQYLITGDKDLLVLHPLGKLQILTLSDFEANMF
jgi:uncharacterized protein